MHVTANGGEPTGDLDWGEIGNPGNDSDAEQFSLKNEGNKGYEELQTPTDVGFLKKFANGRIGRGRNGVGQRRFRQYGKKLTGALKGGTIFGKCKLTWEI